MFPWIFLRMSGLNRWRWLCWGGMTMNAEASGVMDSQSYTESGGRRIGSSLLPPVLHKDFALTDNGRE